MAADDEQGVFDAIWSAFADPSLSRITRRDLDPVHGQVTPGGSPSVRVMEEVCPPHDLLGQESNLKRLVFYRRWYRARVDAR